MFRYQALRGKGFQTIRYNRQKYTRIRLGQVHNSVDLGFRLILIRKPNG